MKMRRKISNNMKKKRNKKRKMSKRKIWNKKRIQNKRKIWNKKRKWNKMKMNKMRIMNNKKKMIRMRKMNKKMRLNREKILKMKNKMKVTLKMIKIISILNPKMRIINIFTSQIPKINKNGKTAKSYPKFRTPSAILSQSNRKKALNANQKTKTKSLLVLNPANQATTTSCLIFDKVSNAFRTIKNKLMRN
jgi:hypothetical protein